MTGVDFPAWLEREPESAEDAVPHIAYDDLGFIGGLRVVAASRRGRSHAHEATYREDAFELARLGDGWAVAVADGAGSAPLARVGSRLAVHTAIAALEAARALSPDGAGAIDRAARAVIRALHEEATRRARDVSDLATTLLLAMYTMADGKPSLTVFQAGDGLIAMITPDLDVWPLGAPDHEAYAGGTHFITGTVVGSTIRERIHHVELERAPQGVVVATDGVSDDLIPYARNVPILVREVDRIVRSDAPGPDLVDLLGYEKRASFDDRTLAVAWRPCPHELR